MRHKRRRRHSARRHRFFNALFGRHHRYGRRHRAHNRRHHRRSRRYNASGGGALSIRRPFEALKSGFKPQLLTKGAVVLGGFVANSLLLNQVNKLGFVAAFLKAGPGSYVIGLGTAGLAGALAGTVMPGYGVTLAFGGVLQQLVRAYNQYLAPMSSYLPKLGAFGDYLTVENAANARPLGYMRDYLTRENAQNARPLGSMADNYIGEELASL